LGLFDRFFKKGEDPVEEYFNSSLGKMLWDDDEESWVGRYKDFKFLISYEY